MLRYSVFFALGTLLAGCPERGATDQGPPAECRNFGDSCLFSPGKLGTCVERATCAPGEKCLTCQSQH